jgi:ATP-binding cassette subfamily F protein uup
VGYLEDFLFTPLEARSLVKNLSGGERSRLVLARLFSRPSNLLVLDEPTNDLDVETLDLLEELLLGYSGTVLVVSHDRAFLDHVVTSTLVFEGDGVVKEYFGGYTDWVRQRPVAAVEPSGKTSAESDRKASRRAARADGPDRPRRLTYREREELAALPDRLETLEAEKAAILGAMARPEFYERDRGAVDEATRRLESLEEQLGAAYARWEELEERSAG